MSQGHVRKVSGELDAYGKRLCARSAVHRRTFWQHFRSPRLLPSRPLAGRVERAAQPQSEEWGAYACSELTICALNFLAGSKGRPSTLGGTKSSSQVLGKRAPKSPASIFTLFFSGIALI